MFERLQDRVMLGAGADQMTAASGVRASESEHRQIIRFGSAAGKNEFVRFRAEQIGEAIARVVHAGARFPSGRMNARRISVMPCEEWLHCFTRGRAKRRGRVIIEIDHATP